MQGHLAMAARSPVPGFSVLVAVQNKAPVVFHHVGQRGALSETQISPKESSTFDYAVYTV
ncbi:hypothetical protein PI125_g17303 [Phytophthora idaei]|nr:hypothetical protein PI125_g17303 [Phytophthora idaei]